MEIFAGGLGGQNRPGEGRRHHGPISTRLLLPVLALFARISIYERYGKIGERAYSGKISTEMMRATHHSYKLFDLINYYSHNLSPV
jgi:hypothetical protein